MVFRFLRQCLKLILPKTFHRTFKTCFTCHYRLGTITKKFVQLTYIVIGLEVLDDGLFSGIAHRQEQGSFVCKHRQTEDMKTKVYSFVYKIFINSFFKS